MRDFFLPAITGLGLILILSIQDATRVTTKHEWDRDHSTGKAVCSVVTYKGSQEQSRGLVPDKECER